MSKCIHFDFWGVINSEVMAQCRNREHFRYRQIIGPGDCTGCSKRMIRGVTKRKVKNFNEAQPGNIGNRYGKQRNA